jgi:hypothetical protein
LKKKHQCRQLSQTKQTKLKREVLGSAHCISCMQQLLRAAALAMMCIAGLGLLAVMATDYWVASGTPLPTHPFISTAVGPLLDSRTLHLYTEVAKLPDSAVSAVLAALAAAVLILCCKQRCWILCRSRPQPSQLVVTQGWIAVILHSAKYACQLLLTNLSHTMPWMAVHHAAGMCVFGPAVWEP